MTPTTCGFDSKLFCTKIWVEIQFFHHLNFFKDGSVQIWDLSKALEQYRLNPSAIVGDLTTRELISLTHQADEAKNAYVAKTISPFKN